VSYAIAACGNCQGPAQHAGP